MARLQLAGGYMYKVYLVGFMGSGKSAIGRRLSFALKLPYYDMDKEIEKQMNMTISEIFATYGEEYFRDLETKFLKDFRDEQCIISTGGGVAMREENRRIMKRTGLVFHLCASFPFIWLRIAKDKRRPIVQRSTKEELESLYYYRRKYYFQAAHINIKTDGMTLRQVTETLAYHYKRLKGE